VSTLSEHPTAGFGKGGALPRAIINLIAHATRDSNIGKGSGGSEGRGKGPLIEAGIFAALSVSTLEFQYNVRRAET